MVRKILTFLAVLCCVVSVAGCRLSSVAGTAAGSGGTGSVGSGGAVGAGTTPQCEPGAESAVTAPTSESVPVISVTRSSPWTPSWTYLPDLVIYSDGSAARNEHESSARLTGPDGGHLDACLVEQMRADLVDLRPSGDDFGDPMAEDAGTTTVRVSPLDGSGEITLGAYLLTEDNQGDDDLTPEQQQSRQRLLSVLDRLSSEFRSTGELPVDRVKVVAGSLDDALSSVADRNAEPTPWPLGAEVPEQLRALDQICFELTGDDAATLAATLAPYEHQLMVHQGEFTFDAEPDAEPLELGIAVLMPGVTGCR